MGVCAPLLSRLVPTAAWWALVEDGRVAGATSTDVDREAVLALARTTAESPGGEPAEGRGRRDERLLAVSLAPALTLVAAFANGASGPSGAGLAKAIGPVRPLLTAGSRGSGTDRASRELDAIYELEDRLDRSLHGQASLSLLIGTLGRQLRSGYAALLIPDKRIRISVTHRSWKAVNRPALDTEMIATQFHEVTRRRCDIVTTLKGCPDPLTIADGPCQALIYPIREADGPVIGVIAVYRQTQGEGFDNGDRRFVGLVARRVERVIEMNYDRLTGLMNRAGFEAHLQLAHRTLEKTPDCSHCLAVFDLDNLQLLNNTFDHRAGDEVIVRFAKELLRRMPEGGVACRLASDDFAVLLQRASVEDGRAFAEDMRLAAHQFSYCRGERSQRVTISAGIAPFRQSDGDGFAALMAPKVACTAAKDHGRDRVEVYDSSDNSIVQRIDDMQIVGQLHSALSDGDFTLMAQPVQALVDEEPTSHFEVLVRMRNAAGELLKPAVFFSAAERYQLMPQLDRWVIDATLKALADHELVLSGGGTSFAINLSGQSLRDDGLLNYVLEALRRYGVPPAVLCFEITETAAVANLETAQRFIATLKRHGCRFSLDDFGVGLSSFNYLKSLDVDYLKIDGSFVHDLTCNKVSEAMVTAITHVARVMGLTTIAEYVETDDVRRMLRQIGVHYAQGYLIGEPVALDTVLARLDGPAAPQVVTGAA